MRFCNAGRPGPSKQPSGLGDAGDAGDGPGKEPFARARDRDFPESVTSVTFVTGQVAGPLDLCQSSLGARRNPSGRYGPLNCEVLGPNDKECLRLSALDYKLSVKGLTLTTRTCVQSQCF